MLVVGADKGKARQFSCVLIDRNGDGKNCKDVTLTDKQ